MKKTFVTSVIGLLSLASAQWSEPLAVPEESTWCNYQFVVLPGDTLCALWTSCHGNDRDSAVAYSSILRGDSWTEPESIDCSNYADCSGAGVDSSGRAWFVRYDGMVPWDRSYSWGVVASVREAGGWRSLGRVLRSPGPTYMWTAGLGFAADRKGEPWLELCEHVHEDSGQYWQARFGRMQEDTCRWPGYVVKGEAVWPYTYTFGADLAPRPDSGMWAASGVWDAIRGHHVRVLTIQSDTARLVWQFGSAMLQADADPSGTFWVFYSDSVLNMWSATLTADSTIAYALIRPAQGILPPAISACVDNQGWAWCAWTAEDSSMVVTWNRGGGWQQPERAVWARAGSSRLASDSRGLVHLFYDAQGRWSMVRRLARPGVEEIRSALHLPAHTVSTIATGTLFLSAGLTSAHSSLLTPDGRKVMELSPGANDVRHLGPGVYFVRAQADGRTVTQKVTLAR